MQKEGVTSVNFDDLMKAVNKMDEYIDLKNSDMVFHFRYATHGGIEPSLTHPFVLSNNYNEMKELQNRIIFHGKPLNNISLDFHFIG